MTEEDRPSFAELLLRLDTVFDKKASKLKGDEYWKGLKDIPIGILRDTVSQHIREARTYPRISDLRVLADVQTEKAEQKLLAPHKANEGAPVRHCDHCGDTGWQLATGDAIETWSDPTTGKAETVKPCFCRKTNPALQPKKRYATANTDVRRPW